MGEYKKNGAGLHKEVSSIFSGVPIPSNGAGPSSTGATGWGGSNGAGRVAAASWNRQSEAASAPEHGDEAAPASNVPTAAVTTKAAGPTTWQKIRNRVSKQNTGVSSTRQKTMVLLIPVLSIALIFVLTRVLWTPARTVAKPKEPKAAVSTAHSSSEIDWEMPPVYPETLRDPMRLTTSTAANQETENQVQTDNGEPKAHEAEKLIVKGIVYSDDMPSAVVGTDIVYEGDVVLGATVVRIHRNSVEFSQSGKTWTQGVEP